MSLLTKIKEHSFLYWLHDNKDFVKTVIVLMTTYATTSLEFWETKNPGTKVFILGLVALVSKKLIDTIDYFAPDVVEDEETITKL